MSFVYYTGEKMTNGIIRTVLPGRNNTGKNRIEPLLQDNGRTDDKERAFFPASFSKASLTIEAALVLPMFLFFALAVISFLMILSLQLDIQNGMDEIARNLTRKAYLVERSGLDASFAGPAAVMLEIQTGPLKDRLDHSQIEGGAGGVNALFSTYNSETGILDIVVAYDYRVFPLPDQISKIHLVQRSRSRAWIGRELDDAGSGENAEKDDEKNNKTVYVAQSGNVYHTSRDCHYLDLSIQEVSQGQVGGLRNKSGSRYDRCPLCAKNAAAGDTVYITDYGENWHTSLSCSGLKRTVTEMNLSEVGNLPLCSKCGARHEAGKEE